MKITKYDHSCLLVEEGAARILLDPGVYSVGESELTNLDAILLTHIHPDHCDIEAIKKIIEKNPQMKIYGNSQVVAKLNEDSIPVEELGDGQSVTINGVLIEGFGVDHVEVHSSLSRDKNTGYLVAGRLFQPGDSYTVPGKPVEILALPIGGPWCKIGEAIDYALEVKPKLTIPIHDAIYADPETYAQWPMRILKSLGVEMRVLSHGQTLEF